jgi:hypothetical protein
LLSLDSVHRDAAIGNIGFAVYRQYLLFIHALEQISETIHDDLMGHDQHTVLDMIAPQDLDNTPHTQDHIAPTFSAGRSEVELPDQGTLGGQLRKFAQDALLCMAIENPELLFPHPLIRLNLVDINAERRCHCHARLSGTYKWRAHEYVWALGWRFRGEPLSQRRCLLMPQVGQRCVGVAA